MSNKKLIIADDHPLLLKGLHDFLTEKKYNIVGKAKDGKEAFELIKELAPDIAILDIQMPFISGLEIAKKCKKESVNTKIVLITLHKEKELFQKAKDLNIYGYILKEFALEEIENCIKTVSSGKTYFSDQMKSLLGVDHQKENELSLLTPSEQKILKLIANGKTNKEIASLLFISYRTVEKHRSNMITKLKLIPKTNSLLIWAKEHHKKTF